MNTSYLTVAEYKRAPTAMDINSIDFTGLGTQSNQDAELANVIARASAWVDNICEMPGGLYASVETETRDCKIDKGGYLTIRPYNTPIISVQSLQWKIYPSAAYETIDVSLIQSYPRYFKTMMWFPFYNGPAVLIGNNYAYPVSAPYTPYLDPSQAGQLQDMPLIVQYTYVNGFPNTTLTSETAIGAQTLTLDDVTGMQAGTVLTVYDGPNTEKITLSAAPSGNTVTVTKPLLFAHSAGVAVSAIPADIKQATVFLVNYLLKERGVNSITMEGATNPLMQKYNDVEDVQLATQLLAKYRRVV